MNTPDRPPLSEVPPEYRDVVAGLYASMDRIIGAVARQSTSLDRLETTIMEIEEERASASADSLPAQLVSPSSVADTPKVGRGGDTPFPAAPTYPGSPA